MTYEIKVYKIWYDDCPDEFYVGSTKSGLSKRMTDHRNKVRQGKPSTIYALMREKGLNNFKYVQVASCMVESIDEQRQFEQHWIDELKPTLNEIKAYATEEDYRESNRRAKQKPEYKAKRREYNARPEIKARQREYESKPEVKQKRREYKQKPEYKEKQKLYQKEYNAKPEVKAKQRETNAKPEVKQKQKEYQKRIHRVCICGRGYRTSPSRAQAHYNTQHHVQYVRDLFIRLSMSAPSHQEVDTCEK